MDSESIELQEEIEKHNNGIPAGPDGIIGEAIDVIACAYDLINQVTMDMSDEEAEALCDRIMKAKCEKWARKYG